MNVYAVPRDVPFTKPDYTNYDFKAERERENRHIADLKAHLIEMGYTGKHTGKIASFGVGDGYANYMLADGSGVYGHSFLIHLPYGDAYHFQYVSKLSKKEIIKKIEQQEGLAALFR